MGKIIDMESKDGLIVDGDKVIVQDSEDGNIIKTADALKFKGDKGNQGIPGVGGVIDDNTVSETTTWSSDQINGLTNNYYNKNQSDDLYNTKENILGAPDENGEMLIGNTDGTKSWQTIEKNGGEQISITAGEDFNEGETVSYINTEGHSFIYYTNFDDNYLLYKKSSVDTSVGSKVNSSIVAAFPKNSTDGAHIYYIDGMTYGIYRKENNGIIEDGVKILGDNTNFCVNFTLSNDGVYIYYINDADGNLWRKNANDSADGVLFGDAAHSWDEEYITISPDGNYILMSLNSDGDEMYRIPIADPTNIEHFSIVGNYTYAAIYTPDGASIVYMNWDDTAGDDVLHIKAWDDTGKGTVILEKYCKYLDISNDSKYLLFTDNDDDIFYTIDLTAADIPASLSSLGIMGLSGGYSQDLPLVGYFKGNNGTRSDCKGITSSTVSEGGNVFIHTDGLMKGAGFEDGVKYYSGTTNGTIVTTGTESSYIGYGTEGGLMVEIGKQFQENNVKLATIDLNAASDKGAFELNIEGDFYLEDSHGNNIKVYNSSGTIHTIYLNNLSKVKTLNFYSTGTTSVIIKKSTYTIATLNGGGISKLVNIGYWDELINSSIGYGPGAIAFTIGTAFGGNSNGSNYGTAVGVSSSGENNGVAIGCQATGHTQGVTVGYNSKGYNYGVAVGYNSDGADYGTSVGYNSQGGDYGTGVGRYAYGYNYGTAVGAASKGYNHGIAVGYAAASSGNVDSYSGAIGWEFKNDKDDYIAFSKGTAGNDVTSKRVGIEFDTTTDDEKVAIEINDSVSAPTVTTNKLYSVGGNLFWNGVQLN